MIDLSPHHLETVKRILDEHVPGCEVKAFGSRATWTATDYSDLDLLVLGQSEVAGATLSRLNEAFEESDLPMRVDVVDWHRTSPAFRKLIEPSCVRLPMAAGADWSQTAFGDCALLVGDKVDPASCGDMPYIGLEHIGQGTLSLLGNGTASDVESTKTAFRAGDILFGKLRPYFRKVVRPDFDGICSTDIWAVRPKAGVDAGFLFYLMASEAFVDFASHGSEGTRMPRAKWEHVARYTLALPPLPKQRAIAHVLHALDDKLELNRRMAKTLEETVRTLFQSWFVDQGNAAGTLADIALLNPESWTSASPPDKVAYVDLSNTKWGSIETIETCAWQDAPSRARRVLRPGDTIVGTVRPANGSHALVGVEGLTGSTGFAVLRPKEAFDAQFVWCAATAPSNIERLAQFADGGAYPAVSPEAIAATEVPLADATTRRKFSSLTTPLVRRHLTCYGEAHELDELRNALLPRLISGEIRVHEAEKLAEAAT